MFSPAVVRSAQIAGLDKHSLSNSLYESEMKWHAWQPLLFLNASVVETIDPERTVLDDPSYKPGIVGPTHTLCDVKACALMRYEYYRMQSLVFRERARI